MVGYVLNQAGNYELTIEILPKGRGQISELNFIAIERAAWGPLIVEVMAGGDRALLDKCVGLENVKSGTIFETGATLAIEQSWGYGRYGYEERYDGVVVQIVFADGTQSFDTIKLPNRQRSIRHELNQ